MSVTCSPNCKNNIKHTNKFASGFYIRYSEKEAESEDQECSNFSRHEKRIAFAK